MSLRETMALEKLCRVCGRSLLVSELSDTFGIDISSDNLSIHPQCYCHPCKNIIYFTQRAKANKTEYNPEWVDHNKPCSVCTAKLKSGRRKKPFKAGRPPNIISPQANHIKLYHQAIASLDLCIHTKWWNYCWLKQVVFPIALFSL